MFLHCRWMAVVYDLNLKFHFSDLRMNRKDIFTLSGGTGIAVKISMHLYRSDQPMWNNAIAWKKNYRLQKNKNEMNFVLSLTAEKWNEILLPDSLGQSWKCECHKLTTFGASRMYMHTKPFGCRAESHKRPKMKERFLFFLCNWNSSPNGKEAKWEHIGWNQLCRAHLRKACEAKNQSIALHRFN